MKDLYDIGEIPPLGHVPAKMHAWVVRKERHGPPEESMQLEVVPTWELDSHDVLVLVMAAGVNYNGVWAALGQPISALDVHKHPYHIAGSDASGIVWAVGSKVKRWKVGDEVVVHCNQDDGDDEECNGGDPMFSASQRIWGYETPDGSFAQFARVQDRQLMERPRHLTWEESACYTLTLATAYRMLFGHEPHRLKPGDNVLIWGASGGLGVFGVQLCAAAGANAIGVISDETKRDYVLSLGAKGVINRKEFKGCWGQLPTVNTPEFNDWSKAARGFGKAIWDITGQEGRRHRLRASGRADLPALLHGGEARRHGGVLRRHHRLQPHLRRALCVDAAKAHPGLAFRPFETGGGGQPLRRRPARRPLHVRGLPLGENPARSHQNVEERACARQYGRAGQRPDHGVAQLRGCDRGGGGKVGRRLRHRERSEAIQKPPRDFGLLRRFAPRNAAALFLLRLVDAEQPVAGLADGRQARVVRVLEQPLRADQRSILHQRRRAGIGLVRPQIANEASEAIDTSAVDLVEHVAHDRLAGREAPHRALEAVIELQRLLAHQLADFGRRLGRFVMLAHVHDDVLAPAQQDGAHESVAVGEVVVEAALGALGRRRQPLDGERLRSLLGEQARAEIEPIVFFVAADAAAHALPW